MSDQSLNNDESLSHFSYISQHTSQQRQLSDKLLEGLQQSRTQMIEFIQGLSEVGETPISDALYRFCGKFRSFQILPKNVIQILEKRIERMTRNKRRKKNWNNEDSKILIWSASKYMQQRGIEQIQQLILQDWKNISDLIPGSLPESCMFKILNLKKTRLSENKWTQEESAILSQLAVKYKKKNWRRISQKLYLINYEKEKTFRNAKQCKEHWTCFLNPQLKKGTWDVSEDKALFQYVLNNEGQKRWSNLTKIIKGRTQNALKNRYNIILERESQKSRSNDEIMIITNYLKKIKLGFNRNMYLNRKKPQKKQKIEEGEREKSVKNKNNLESPQKIQNDNLQQPAQQNKTQMLKPSQLQLQQYPLCTPVLYPFIFQNTNIYFLPYQSLN